MYIIAKERPKVRRGATAYWDVLQFGDGGATYRGETGAVSGVTKKGAAVDVPLQDVLYGECRYYDFYRNARIVLTGVVAVILYLGASSYK